MSTSLVPATAGTTLATLSAVGALGLPCPRELTLLETVIAGTTFADSAPWLATLAPGTSLRLRREPDNAHDRFAVSVWTHDGRRAGFLPRERNEVIARLLDAGKDLGALLGTVKVRGRWAVAALRVVLREA